MAHKFLPDSRKLSDYEGSVLRVPHLYFLYRWLVQAVQIYLMNILHRRDKSPGGEVLLMAK